MGNPNGPKCDVCGDPIRNGFDALMHAFEHEAEHRDRISLIAQACADDVAAQNRGRR